MFELVVFFRATTKRQNPFSKDERYRFNC